MKRYSFNSFRIDGENKSAVETCQQIGGLSYDGPNPVLLVGDGGCGKTHLIYSIVNELRSGSAKVSLAVATAAKFPAEVRALAHEPSPVKRAKSALLLVDQLEGFAEHAEDLAAVIRVFLDSGHIVVAASNRPPEQLTNLPVELRELLANGNVIDLSKRELQEQTPAPALGAADETMAALRAQVDSLCNQLDDERRSNAIYERELEWKVGEQAALRQELEQARQQLGELRQEKEETSGRLAALAEQVESYISYFGEGEQAQREHLAELEQMVESLQRAGFAGDSEAVTRAESAEAELEAARRAFAAIREQWEREMDEAESQLSTIREERDGAQARLAELESGHADLQGRVESLQQLATAQRAEIESLKTEAATQVAEANAHAGELERNTGRAIAAHEADRATAASQLRSASDALIDVAQSLEKAAELLKPSKPAIPLAPKEPPGNLAILDRLAVLQEDDSSGPGRAVTTA